MPRAIDLRQLEADYDPNRSGTEFHLGAYTSGFAEMWQKILAKVQEDLEASVIAAIEELLGIDLSSFSDVGGMDWPSLSGLMRDLERIFGGVSGSGGATLPATLPFTLGGASSLGVFVDNLRAFFTGLDFLDPDFDPFAAVETFITDILTPTNLLASAQSVQDVIDTVWQAITRAINVDNPLEDLFEALQNIPALNVLGVGGPSTIGDSIRATLDQLISGLVGSIGTGASFADLFNISRDVSSRATSGWWAFDILGIRNNKSLNSGFLPTSISNIALDKVALQSSAPTFALTQSTAITAYHRISESADMSVVSWMGSGVTNITAAFVSIFKMDPVTGLSTLVHESADIVGLLSNTLQHNIYVSPTPIPAVPGDIFGTEIAVRGSGTHSIVGASTWLPDHPTVFPRRMSAVRNSGTSAAPSTIAHSALTYSANVPFVEFAVSSGDTGIPHSPQTDFFGTVGTVTTPIQTWANTVEVVVVGAGGGGRQGGALGLCGEGGAAGVWAAGTWTRGTDFTGTPTVTVTIAAGGAGGFTGLGIGGDGGATTVSITGHTVTGAGGAGGDVLGGSGNLYGRTPGNTVYGGITYAGGARQNTSGSAGAPSGGGGSGGNGIAFQYGGTGAPGGAWLRFKQ